MPKREWFLRPSLQATVIESRLDAISYLVEPSLAGFRKDVQLHLKNVRDLSSVITRIR